MSLKKFIFTLLSVCMICTTTVTVMSPSLTTEAHSGRTDRYGGHKDNKNKSGLGYYHYHCGGYPAHLHKDGICPYAGTTITNSSSSSNTGKTVKTETDNNTNQSSNSNSVQQSISMTDSATVSTVKISDTSYDNVAFNASYYANKHKDVYDIYGDNAKALYDHFISSGITEGRQSSAQFNIFVYKSNNQDLADAFGDDLIKYYNHFIECGYNERRVSN